VFSNVPPNVYKDEQRHYDRSLGCSVKNDFRNIIIKQMTFLRYSKLSIFFLTGKVTQQIQMFHIRCNQNYLKVLITWHTSPKDANKQGSYLNIVLKHMYNKIARYKHLPKNVTLKEIQIGHSIFSSVSFLLSRWLLKQAERLKKELSSDTK